MTNIDRLHQRAGSRDVVELHGDILIGALQPLWLRDRHAVGDRPGARRRAAEVRLRRAAAPRRRLVRRAPADGGLRARGGGGGAADLFVAAGTSASVYPAAGLIEIAAAAGAEVVEINREETPLSHLAHRSLREPAGTAFPRLTLELLARGGAGR
ncbi:MAG: hypothetical protein R2862_09245 [Thermoanaerobaculia bacterium]